MKEIIVLVIGLSLPFSGLLTVVEGETFDKESFGDGIWESEFEEGNVTQEKLLKIYDWHDLNNMRENLTCNYILMNDLDENTEGYDELVDTEDGWDPIGDHDEKEVGFNGTFDGNGHVISHLYINRFEKWHIGLFGYVDYGAEIIDVGLIDIVNVSGDSRIGGLVGTNSGVLKNTFTTGNVDGDNHVGGLVGINRGTVVNSYTTCDVSGDSRVGGLIGTNSGVISNSYATGDVRANSDVGGLIGVSWNTVVDSYAAGQVGGYERIGGLVGYNFGTVKNSYSAGHVDGEKDLGGLIGRNGAWFTASTFENSHYNIDGVLINGENKVTIGGLFDTQFNDWIGDMKLDIEDYSDTLLPSNDYYEISCVDGFKDLLGFASEKKYNFRLTEDIDLSSEPGLYIPYLAADFDGDGYIISNLYIDMPFASRVGMFGHVSNGNITNIGIVDANVSGDQYVGGLVGFNELGTIFGSYATGEVSGDMFVGALIGRNDYTVSNSYATGGVGGVHSVGGLVGRNSAYVENSYSTGKVSGNSSLGGLIGYNPGSVFNSFWDIEASGTGESDGGTGKTTEEMKDVATYTDVSIEGLDEPWDFVADPYDDEGDEDIWNIDLNGIINEGYPFFSRKEEQGEYELNVYIVGEGYLGINSQKVGNGWSGVFDEEEVLKLTAMPEENWCFKGWTGDVPEDVEGEEIIITMDENKEITAHFEEKVEEEEEEENEEGEDIPGFNSTLLLLTAIIAVAVYHKKR